MTSLSLQQPPFAASRSLRRLIYRAACASAIAVVGFSVPSTVASAAPGSPVEAPILQSGFAGLRVGAQGSDVTSLQRVLIAAGINVPGGADGVFGPATRGAVVEFQSSHGLPATGEVDQATSNALASAGSGGGSSSSGGSTSSGYVGLRQGARGPAVATVQRQLAANGVYVAGGADGVYGPATTTAVKQFQRWNGFTQTGGLTIRTAAALGLGGDATPPASTPTAPPATSSNPYVGLKQGANGDKVKELQAALQNTGLVLRGGADGVFGPATTAALKAFQGFNGIPQSGVLSERGAEVLKLGSGGGPSTPPADANSPYLGLKVGARGSAVKDVQQALMAAGVTVRGGADGAFGNVTKTALTSYQTSVGVTADGTVNQATIDKLGLGSSRGPTPFAGSTPSGSTPPPATPGNPYVGLTVGARGSQVAELQRALQGTGLVVRGGADGVFGNATKTALQAFQKVNGIPQTGVTTERGVKLLALGSGGGQGAANPNSGGGVVLDRFPVQGRCFFGDTWGAARGGGRTHEGVDIISNSGNLLYAVTDGEITKFFWDQPGALAGNGLRLTQANGTYFTYLHLSGFAPGVTVGTQVEAGDVIGFVGNTGSSATPHLHFEVHPGGGSAVNPYPYVKAIDDCGNTTPRYQSSFT
jgi:peptidoglycan hydrolase-like protein with peptidoglycan-binding domain